MVLGDRIQEKGKAMKELIEINGERVTTPTLREQVLELSESVAMLARLARNGDHSTATLTALETLSKFVRDGIVVLLAE